MRTGRNDIHILRCEEDGCGVSFMHVKGENVDEKIGLAFPRRVDMDRGEEVTGVCGRHTGR